MDTLSRSIDVLCNTGDQFKIFRGAVAYADRLREQKPGLRNVELVYRLNWQGGEIKTIKAAHPNGYKHVDLMTEYNALLREYIESRRTT